MTMILRDSVDNVKFFAGNNESTKEGKEIFSDKIQTYDVLCNFQQKGQFPSQLSKQRPAGAGTPL